MRHRFPSRIRRSHFLLNTYLIAGLASATVAAPQVATTRESVDSAGAQAIGGASANARMTPNGRFIVYTSNATNLVAGDTNNQPDAFLRDRLNSTTTRMSVDAGGIQGNGPSGDTSVSDDGRYVAFTSGATNLIVGDTNNSTDVFVKDRQTGSVTRVNLSSAGVPGFQFCESPRISGNGRYVLFASFDTVFVAGDTNNLEDLFVRDLQTNTTTRVNVDSAGVQANAYASYGEISADGRYVLFSSAATNLVAGDTNVAQDVFLHDNQTGQTTRVSLDSAGNQIAGHSTGPRFSGNAEFICFDSSVNNLVAGDTNGQYDVIVRELATGALTLASTSSSGASGNAASTGGILSYDGRYVAFSTIADNLIAGDTTNFNFDALLKDRVTGATTRLSVSTAGVGGNAGSFADAISADGRFVCMESECTNLVVGDTNNQYDVYLRDRGIEAPVAYCTAKTNSLGCVPAIGYSGSPSATSASPFLVTASLIINHRFGVLFYGYGPNNVTFQGGYLCVRAPLIRTGVQDSAGNAPPDDCSGSFAYDFNARIQSGVDQRLAFGRTVFCQYWYRDPASASTTGLSDGLRFVIGP